MGRGGKSIYPWWWRLGDILAGGFICVTIAAGLVFMFYHLDKQWEREERANRIVACTERFGGPENAHFKRCVMSPSERRDEDYRIADCYDTFGDNAVEYRKCVNDE